MLPAKQSASGWEDDPRPDRGLSGARECRDLRTDKPSKSCHPRRQRKSLDGRGRELGFRYPRHTAIRIEQQRKRQAVLADKRLVRVGRIDAASEYRDTRSPKMRIAVAKG